MKGETTMNEETRKICNELVTEVEQISIKIIKAISDLDDLEARLFEVQKKIYRIGEGVYGQMGNGL